MHQKSLSLSFAIFRILFSSIFIGFLIYLYYLDIAVVENAFQYIIPLDLIFTLFILLGYRYNLFKILFFITNLLLLYFFHKINAQNIYHPAITFRLLAILNFMIVVLPLNATLSIDRVLSSSLKPVYIYNYNYTFFIYVVALIYFDGAIYKSLDYSNWLLHSDSYFLKIYLSANDYIRDNILVDTLINHPTLAQIILIITYLYQLSFIFIVSFFKKLKITFFIIGIFIHIGMMLFFDFFYITLFTLIFYIPLLPNKFYYKLFGFFRRKNIKIIVTYDNSCSSCSKYIKLLKSFDFSNKIFLVGQDLSKESEILINIEKTLYKGVNGFRELFKYFYLTYPLYLLLNINFIFKFATFLYTNFSKNRSKIVCTLKESHIKEYKKVLSSYLVVSMIGLVAIKFKIALKFYLTYSLFLGIYPVNVFIIKSQKAIYHSHFHIENKNKKKIYISKNSNRESKYENGFLRMNFNKNIKSNIYLKNIFKEEANRICQVKQKFLFRHIEKIKMQQNIKENLDKYFISQLRTAKLKCYKL